MVSIRGWHKAKTKQKIKILRKEYATKKIRKYALKSICEYVRWATSEFTPLECLKKLVARVRKLTR
jgi:hypothetical protein